MLPPSVDLKNDVGVVVWEAAAAFVHAGDVHVACGQVAGDLDVADEGNAGGDLSRVGPSGTVVSGEADEEGSPPTLKSFQETYIRPKKGEDGLLSAQPDSRSSLLLL